MSIAPWNLPPAKADLAYARLLAAMRKLEELARRAGINTRIRRVPNR